MSAGRARPQGGKPRGGWKTSTQGNSNDNGCDSNNYSYNDNKNVIVIPANTHHLGTSAAAEGGITEPGKGFKHDGTFKGPEVRLPQFPNL